MIPTIPRRQLDLGNINFFEPVAEDPAGNQLIVRAGWLSKSLPSLMIQKTDQLTVAFVPVSGASLERWDLVTLNLDGNVQVTQGTEQVVGVPEFTGVPGIQRDVVYPIAYVHITESGAVQIQDNDITDIRPKYHFWERIPPGTINMWMADAPPIGYLPCVGETIGNGVSGADYADEIYRELFDLIKNWPPNAGTEVFDSGNTVVLPDLQGYFPAGYKSGDADFGTYGGVGGSKTIDTNHYHTAFSSTEPAHSHSGYTGYVSADGVTAIYNNASPLAVDHRHVISADGSHDHAINVNFNGGPVPSMPPFKVLAFIIKI